LGVVVEPSYNAEEVTSEMIAVPNGAWVRHDDYARLQALTVEMDKTINASQAECRRLKAEVERLQSIHSIDSIGIEQLKAEVERLTSDIQMEKENEDRLVREWQKANNEVYGLHTQVAALIDDQTRLKAQVERLTKAGDELHAFLINYIVESRISSSYLNKLDDDWQAAKEGKQP
jgi:chromosome segregation ATPase